MFSKEKSLDGAQFRDFLSSISYMTREATASHLFLLDRQIVSVGLFKCVAVWVEEGCPSLVAALYDSGLFGPLPRYSVSPELCQELLHPFAAQPDLSPVGPLPCYYSLPPEACLGLSNSLVAQPDSDPVVPLPRYLLSLEQGLRLGVSHLFVAQPDSSPVGFLLCYSLFAEQGLWLGLLHPLVSLALL